jgi:hypothetical protein
MLFNKTFEAFCAWIVSCSNLGVGTWLTTWLVFPTFRLSSLVFCTTFRAWLGPPQLLIANIPWCVCTHPIDPMGVHFLCCVHGNKHTRTHDAIHDTFFVIARNVDLHVGWEQLHAFPSITFNSFHRQIDIVPTKDGICTLANVVIMNPTWVDLWCIPKFLIRPKLGPSQSNNEIV